MSRTVGVPAIPSARTYAFSSPNSGAEALNERTAQTRISSHMPVDRPHLAFVNCDGAGGTRHARSRGDGRDLSPVGDLSEQRLRPGAADGGRRDVQAASARRCSGCRPAGSTRTPAQGNNQRRRLRQPDGRRSATACSRSTTTCATRGCSTTRWCCSSPSSAGASPRTAARAPITAPPASCWRWAAACAAASTAPRRSSTRTAESDAREQRRRRPIRDRLPLGLRDGARQLARRELRRILARITGPVRLRFSNHYCAGWHSASRTCYRSSCELQRPRFLHSPFS